jgi:hypothetical protein
MRIQSVTRRSGPEKNVSLTNSLILANRTEQLVLTIDAIRQLLDHQSREAWQALNNPTCRI